MTEHGPVPLVVYEGMRIQMAMYQDQIHAAEQRIADLEAALTRIRAYVPTPEEAENLLPLAFSSRLALIGLEVDLLVTRAGERGAPPGTGVVQGGMMTEHGSVPDIEAMAKAIFVELLDMSQPTDHDRDEYRKRIAARWGDAPGWYEDRYRRAAHAVSTVWQDRIAAFEAALARAEEAFLLWEKFGWYASGESGFPPIPMPETQASVVIEARARGRDALTALLAVRAGAEANDD